MFQPIKTKKAKWLVAFILILGVCFLVGGHNRSKWLNKGEGQKVPVWLKKEPAITGEEKQASILPQRMLPKLAALSVPFIPNAGQLDDQVKFEAPILSGSFYLTSESLVYSFIKKDISRAAIDGGRRNRTKVSGRNSFEPAKLIAFKEVLLDGQGQTVKFSPRGEKPSATTVSCFRGNSSSTWKSGLTTYSIVSLGEIYPGVELQLRAAASNIEKVFFLRPGISPDVIRLKVEGVQSLSASPEGKLTVVTAEGPINMSKPLAFQETGGIKTEVDVEYAVRSGTEYGFKIAAYDPSIPLVIDPAIDTLLASTFLGGNGSEDSIHIALDPSGYVYVSGQTNSTDFPDVMGVFGVDSYGSIFISKFDRDLSLLLSSVFLGGSHWDLPQAFALDGSGSVFIAGLTYSHDFPVTAGAFDSTFHGSAYWDAFLSKFDSELTTLQASTYLGGSLGDEINSIAFDSSDNIYAGGATESTEFPVSPSAFQTVKKANYDGFVCAFDPNLSVLRASTFIGGLDVDDVSSLALDSSGNVYSTGRTFSSDFPVSSGAYDTVISDQDVFVAKFDPELTNLEACTYLGGSSAELESKIVIDNSGEVLVAGSTSSADFPVTPGAYDQSLSSYGEDIFISRFSGDLSNLKASTFLGGSWGESCLDMILDGAGNVYIVGETHSADFPVTYGSYDLTFNGRQGQSDTDAFVSRLNGSLSYLAASTYLGGIEGPWELASSIAIDPSGNLYVAGYTWCADFPVTSNAYDKTFNGGVDAFISKFSVQEVIDLDVTIDTSPSGFSVIVDGEPYVGPAVFHWREGTEHTISVSSPLGLSTAVPKPARTQVQPSRWGKMPETGMRSRLTPNRSGEGGTRYSFSRWSDGGEQSHTITVRSSTWQYIAYFTRQYTLSVGVNPPEGGTVNPSGLNWLNEGVKAIVMATANSGYEFSSWSGDIIGNSSSISVTMDSPKSLTANFIKASYPPVNLSLQRLENNLIFFKEYINRLSWQPNPLNIIQMSSYRLYYKPRGSGDENYRRLTEVNASTLSYDHRGLKLTDLYTYRITAVNIEGHEGQPVEISN